MSDIGITWDKNSLEGVISYDSDIGDLKPDNGLYTAVLISLFTDARARDDDALPDVISEEDFPNRRGWWGDSTSEKDNDSVVLRQLQSALLHSSFPDNNGSFCVILPPYHSFQSLIPKEHLLIYKLCSKTVDK